MIGKAGREHPETAKEAARAAKVRDGQLRVLHLLALAEDAGAVGLIDEDIEEFLQKKHDPRRLECVEAGWVVNSGLRQKTSRGSGAIVWRLTSEGRALTKS